MRTLAVASALVSLVFFAQFGCGGETCRPGSVFLSVSLSAAAVQADTLLIEVELMSATRAVTLSHTPGESSLSIEVQLPGEYAPGATLIVRATAKANAMILALSGVNVTLGPSCTNAKLSIGDTGNECVPASCGSLGVGCGDVDDGCGGTLACGTCAIYSASPSVGNAGQTVLLEGVFSSTVQVQFAGVSAAQTATPLGANRASVVIPMGAGEGAISVTTGGQTLAGPLVRGASFAVGLSRADRHHSQDSYARPLVRLRAARTLSDSVRIGSYVYILGGNLSGAPTETVGRWKIHSDGSLAMLSDAGPSLLAPSRGLRAIVVGNFLYVVGGRNNTMFSKTVQRAPIAADSTLGAFVDAGVTLVEGRAYHDMAVVGAYLYVIGGASGDGVNPETLLTTVERARINSDGTLGAFAVVSGVTLKSARSAHAVKVVRDGLYVFGGGDAMTSTASVERAPIAADGTLGDFAPTTSTLDTARGGAAAIFLGDSIYVIGGKQNTTPLDTVARATVQNDGTLGAFAPVAGLTLNVARDYVTAATAGNDVYLFSGAAGSIERLSFNTSGAFAPFAVAPNTSSPTKSACVVALPKFVYTIGGTVGGGSTTAITRAPVDSNGAMGAFVDAGVTLVQARQWATCLVTDHKLYVIGGADASGSIDTVEEATFDDDGNLSAFTASLSRLVNPRRSAAILAAGSSVYVVGGFYCTGGPPCNMYFPLATIERASLDADGLLGSFAIDPNTALIQPRYTHALAVVGNKVYVSGGFGPTGGPGYVALTSVERASLDANGNLSMFTDGGSLAEPQMFHTLAVAGNFLYSLGGRISDGGAFAALERAAIDGQGNVGAFVAVPGLGFIAPRMSPKPFHALNSTYFLGADTVSGTTVESVLLQ